jgi:hypothetical protein
MVVGLVCGVLPHAWRDHLLFQRIRRPLEVGG